MWKHATKTWGVKNYIYSNFISELVGEVPTTLEDWLTIP